MYERIKKTSSSGTPQHQTKFPSWTPPKINVQSQTDSAIPPKPAQAEQMESQAFQQHQFEATKLEIQAKHGTITPEGQERLGILQAKMNAFWQKRLEGTKNRPNLLQKAINENATPTTKPPAPIDNAQRSTAPVSNALAIDIAQRGILPGETIQAQRGEGTTESEQESGEELEQRLDDIERRYRDMIQAARDRGADVAADNLERFLAGTGGTKVLSVNWLRGFDAITEAERLNQERFENTLKDLAAALKPGETRSFTDHWDRMLTADTTTELYYASGTSTIRSTGNFQLKRNGDTVEITGTVNHHWFDPYDWHAGLAAYIPGFGSISDADALLLQQHRDAKSFDMESDWQQTVTGTVTVRDWWFDSAEFTWDGP